MRMSGAAYGDITPFSVIIASMYSAGVTSNAGFSTSTLGCAAIQSLPTTSAGSLNSIGTSSPTMVLGLNL